MTITSFDKTSRDSARVPACLASVDFWGQATLRLQFPGVTLLTDPYLTDSVAEREGPALRRLRPAPHRPHDVHGIDWILVSHAHLDHCDAATIGPILEENPGALVVGPSPVVESLIASGISGARLQPARNEWSPLGPGVRIHPVPACHPAIDLDESGLPRQMGFLIEADGTRYYFAGDTSMDDEIVETLRALGQVDVAFLPVNEKNHYRGRQGILGNMSIREAFQMAEEIGARYVFPIHWDMFAPNRVYPEEIRAVYDRTEPAFDLVMAPEVT